MKNKSPAKPKRAPRGKPIQILTQEHAKPYTREELETRPIAEWPVNQAFSRAGSMASSLTDPMPRPFFTDAEKDIVRKMFLEPFTAVEQEYFFTVCQRVQLDPMARQIYAVARRENAADYNEKPDWRTKMLIVTSIEGLRVIAERTGEYEGQTHPMWCNKDGFWHDVWLNDGVAPYAAKIGVRRKGFTEPLYAVARYDSFVQTRKVGAGEKKEIKPTSFWEKMADNQLLKCAEAQALRKAFPQPLSGLFIEDELRDPEQDAAAHEVASRQPAMPEGSTWVEGHSPEEIAAKRAAKPETKPEEKETPKKQAPLPDKKPETKPEPKATESKTGGPAAALDHVLKLSHKEFNGKRIGDLSLEQLKRIESLWIKTWSEKIWADPEKTKQANYVLEVIKFREAK